MPLHQTPGAGPFVWPVTRDGKVHLTPAQLSSFLRASTGSTRNERNALESVITRCKVRIWTPHLLMRMPAWGTVADATGHHPPDGRIQLPVSQRVAAYASEINRLKALVANCSACSSVKAQKNFAQKPNEDTGSTGANQRTSGRNGGNAGEQYDPVLPSALRQSSARKPYRPHFPVKPGLSGRKRNAVLLWWRTQFSGM